VAAGQGAVQITGSTDQYFYLSDGSGKSVTNGKIGTAVHAKPGEYRIKLNGSTHPVVVKEKMLTKCSAGAVLLSGLTDEYYYVQDVTGASLANGKIGQALDFFPDKYRVVVNKTSTEAEVKPGAVLELKAGLLRALGTTDEYYYVLDSTGANLANNKLSAPLSLLPGNLSVKINNSTAPVRITAGGTIELQTGAVMVQGTTDEYYYVIDATGNQLANNKLNRALSFVEGAYTVKLNNAKFAVKVEAGKTSEYQTATLTVKGAGNAYYYVLDANGTNLASNKLNQPLAFPDGSYSVKVGNETRPVTLATAKAVVVNW